MPELPEVEVMVKKLRGWTLDQGFNRISLTSVSGPRKRLLPGKEGDIVADGLTLRGVFRRGKYIIFDCCDDRDSWMLVGHNAMSGYWDREDDPWTFNYVEGKRTSTAKDVRVVLELRGSKGGEPRYLRFHDARKFGSLRLYQGRVLECYKQFAVMGPEAIETECMYGGGMGKWNLLDLAVCADTDRTIKEVLMDQHSVIGIGNIYANEGLWSACVDPRRAGKSLTRDEVQDVYDCCQLVLKNALHWNLDYSKLGVYRRKTCLSCGSGIIVEKIKGRGTYRCPRCQV